MSFVLKGCISQSLRNTDEFYGGLNIWGHVSDCQALELLCLSYLI